MFVHFVMHLIIYLQLALGRLRCDTTGETIDLFGFVLSHISIPFPI